MKRFSTNIYIIIINTILLFGCVGIVINVSPYIKPEILCATTIMMSLSNPMKMYDDYKTKFSSNLDEASEDNNTTVSNLDSTQAMHSVSAEDSKDDTDITQTPKDILKLMEDAKKSEEKPKGKTSEESYQGGGRIISYNGIQIQSKIPKDVYNPDIKSLLEQGSDLKIKDKTKPAILIYHSHTTEAYSMLDTGYYIKSDARQNDISKNMVRVGDDLAEYLERQGFVVIHDKAIHDKDYNSSYDSSRKVVEKYLEEYPSIEVTIDVHRDDITYSNKTKVKPTAIIKDKKAARMMIISGCEYNRVKNFPDWEENLKFDLAVQQKLNEKYEGLMRPILFSERKYNMYETHYSFLLEIGTDANTLDEACYSARLFGNALGELLNERYIEKE